MEGRLVFGVKKIKKYCGAKFEVLNSFRNSKILDGPNVPTKDKGIWDGSRTKLALGEHKL